MRIQELGKIADGARGVLAEAKKDMPLDVADVSRAVRDVYEKDLSKGVERRIELAVTKALDSKNAAFRKATFEIVKDTLESYAKTIWTKRRFWLGDLDI